MLCTADQVRARAQGQLTGWTTEHIEGVIESVSQAMQEESAREFESGAAGEERVYEAPRDGYAPIEDALIINSVTYRATEVDTEIAVATTAYRTKRHPRALSVYALDNGPWAAGALVHVTGQYGYADVVPADIADAAIAWTLRTLKSADAAYQDATAIPEMGQLVFSKAIPADVRRVLERYARKTPVRRVS